MSKQYRNIIILAIVVFIVIIGYWIYAATKSRQTVNNQPGTSSQQTAAVLEAYNHKTIGPILADVKGMTLYIYTRDSGSTSNCYGQCAVNWPPLLTQGAPQGTNIDKTKLGTTQRTDGTTQVTYDGKPLYYFINDKAAGDTTGQNVGGIWFYIKL